MEKINSSDKNTSLSNIDYGLLELTGLPSEFFAINFNSYLTNLSQMLSGMEEDSVIVLQGGNEVPRFDTDVVNYHFLQEGSFYYLTGVVDPKFYAVLDVKQKSITLFYQVNHDEREKIFMRPPTLEELIKKYNLPVLDQDNFYSELKKRNPKKIYVMSGTNSDSGHPIVSAKLDFPSGYEDLATKLDFNPYIYEILADTRTRKSQSEINLLRYVNKITIEAHLNAYKRIKADVNERDVENGFFNYLKNNYYCRIWAYAQICGCGVNSSILHYEDNSKILKNGDLMLLDMGVRYAGYCSDITATVPVNGKFTTKQADIYNIVLNANREVIKNLKPGVYYPDMHLLAERVILTGLVKLGLLNSGFDIDTMLKDRVAYYFMPHGLGHFMGVEVHDVGGYLSFTPKRSELSGLSSLRTARYLNAGNIITVEPGIYFIQFLLEKAFADENLKKYFNVKIKEYYNFGGIRIEDDVLITVDGCENFTQSLPRTVKEIEDMMAGR